MSLILLKISIFKSIYNIVFFRTSLLFIKDTNFYHCSTRIKRFHISFMASNLLSYYRFFQDDIVPHNKLNAFNRLCHWMAYFVTLRNYSLTYSLHSCNNCGSHGARRGYWWHVPPFRRPQTTIFQCPTFLI